MGNARKLEKKISLKCGRYGKTIYLLGTASLGPTNTPIAVSSLSHLYSVFGLKGSLIDAYRTISKETAGLNIVCCKVSGNHSAATLNVNVSGDKVERNALVFKSKSSSPIYNDILINLYQDSITFTMPSALGGNTVEYKFSDFHVIGELINKINKDTDIGINHVYARATVDESTELCGAIDTVNPSSVYMYGGTDGTATCKSELYYDLKYSLELLEGRLIDIIVPIDMYMDDIELNDAVYGESEYGSCYYSDTRDKLRGYDGVEIKSYYNILLKFCCKQLQHGVATLAMIGYNQTNDMHLNDNSSRYIEDVLLKYNEINKFNKALEYGRPLVQVVAGDLMSATLARNINSVYQYAITVAKSSLSLSPTNAQLSKSIFLFNEFDNDELRTLSENGIVAFRHSPLKNRVVVSSGVTSARQDSEMFYIQNARMAQMAVSCAYDVFEECIGEDINRLLKGELKDLLTSCFNILVEKELLSDYKIDIVRTGTHNIEVRIDIKSVYMVDFVRSTCVINMEEF